MLRPFQPARTPSPENHVQKDTGSLPAAQDGMGKKEEIHDTHPGPHVIGEQTTLRVINVADTSAAHSRPVTTRVGSSISPAPRYTSSQCGLQLSLRHAFAWRLVCQNNIFTPEHIHIKKISRQVRRLEASRSRSGERRAWEASTSCCISYDCESNDDLHWR